MDVKNVVSPIMGNTPSASVKNTSNAEFRAGKQQVQVDDALVKGFVEKTDANAKVEKTAVDQAVNKVNELFQAERRRLSFSVNDTTQDVVIEVKDAETDEVIRQIPPEIIVKLAEHLQEMSAEESVGVLLKDKA